MTWRVEIAPRAERQLAKLSKGDAQRILAYLFERVAGHPDPHSLAKRLAGQDEQLWRFRVGDYRLIAKFLGDRLVILIVEIGNRREIYR
ncbi:type II toxin-antitoxin system RelE family toxin [Mesorhizobium sp. ASY16-5R]|uniref:type II toxin-antitoxin system RelE family toxin n=1 Tax=Mesorhizobium sp. ASY16-5R TaxID=3445772 RepID=UPI003FA02DB4